MLSGLGAVRVEPGVASCHGERDVAKSAVVCSQSCVVTCKVVSCQ